MKPQSRTPFDQSAIGSLTLENRFFRTACGDSHGVNGHISKEDIALYERLADGVLEKRISDSNERIEENPNKIRTVYVGRYRTEFRFENGEESVWDKIEY